MMLGQPMMVRLVLTGPGQARAGPTRVAAPSPGGPERGRQGAKPPLTGVAESGASRKSRAVRYPRRPGPSDDRSPGLRPIPPDRIERRHHDRPDEKPPQPEGLETAEDPDQGPDKRQPHEADCPRHEAINEVPPIMQANQLVSVRAYDADHQCLYDLGQVCSGDDVGAPLQRALTDLRTSFVNVHTARPGCLLTLVERVCD